MNYTENGEKVFNYFGNCPLGECDVMTFAVTMAEFAVSGYSIDDVVYTVEKWYKYCDEIAEWLLVTNPEWAKELGLEEI